MKYVRFDPAPSYAPTPIYLVHDAESLSTWQTEENYREIRRDVYFTVLLMENTSESEWDTLYPHLCRRGFEECVYDMTKNVVVSLPRVRLRRIEARQAVVNEQLAQFQDYWEQHILLSSPPSSPSTSSSTSMEVDEEEKENIRMIVERDNGGMDQTTMEIDEGNMGDENSNENRCPIIEEAHGIGGHQQQQIFFRFDHDAIRRACNNNANIMLHQAWGARDAEAALAIYLEDYEPQLLSRETINMLLHRNYKYTPN